MECKLLEPGMVAHAKGLSRSYHVRFSDVPKFSKKSQFLFSGISWVYVTKVYLLENSYIVPHFGVDGKD